jgi:hypothetical protein
MSSSGWEPSSHKGPSQAADTNCQLETCGMPVVVGHSQHNTVGSTGRKKNHAQSVLGSRFWQH